MRSPSMLFVAALATLALALPPTAQAATYTWNVAGSGSFIVSTNWTPQRSTHAATDVLVFNNGAANVVTNVFGETIGQLLVQSGTSVELRANSTGHTITIAGGSGTDLDVPTGAGLAIGTANALALNIGASATGVIGGTVTLGGGNHRLRANSVDGLIVQGGGQVRSITGFIGNPFGTGTDALSVFNSVRFQAGSVFLQEAGSNPFAATAPNSVVVFDHGSRYVNRNATTLQFSGRTYGDLEYDSPGTMTALGSQAWTVDSLILTQGALAIGMIGAVHIKGSIRIQPGTNLQLGTGSGGTVYLDGTAPQLISDPSFGDGIVQATGHSLVIDNPAGVACSQRLRLRSNLHFLQGVLSTQEWVDLDSTGTITNASQATGWVTPNVARTYSPARPPALEFAIGTETSYSPMTVQFGSITGDFRVEGSVFSETFEQADAELDPDRSLNLIYLVIPTSVPDTSDWNGMVVTAKYQDVDLDPAADSTALVMRVKSFNIGPGADPWRSTTPFGPFQANQVMALVPKYRTGDALHTFLIGEPAELTLATSSGNSSPEGGAAPEARVSEAGGVLGANVASFDVHLSQVAIEDTVRVDYATADSTATVANNDYVPVSGTLVFLPGDTLKTVNVTLVGDGTPERDEIFRLNLSNPSNATLLTTTSVFTITDDDDHSAPVVQVVGPNGGEVAILGAPTNLTWNASDNVAIDFVGLWISRNSGGTWTKIVGFAPNTGSYSWTVTGMPTNQARLRVIAYDDPGNSAQDESDADWTITSTTDVEPVSSTAFELALPMPMPARTKALLAYALPRASPVRLTVHDIAGRVVETLVDQELPPGRHMASWNATRHAAGLYLVRMQAGEFTATRRIVVTR